MTRRRITEAQYARLMMDIPLERRINLLVNAGKKLTMTQIINGKNGDLNHGSILIPDWVPRTRETSGLVNPELELDDSQAGAIERLRAARFGILMGAAGTGKTTIAKRFIADYIYGGDGFSGAGVRDIGEGRLSIAVVAFTGLAVEVIRNTLPSWMARSCMTIHSLLEYKAVEDGDTTKRGVFYPTRDADRPLDQDFIIADETSMIGMDLWEKVIDACRPGTRLLFIGDLNQLTPVADTPMFPLALKAAIDNRDDAGDWALAELTKIHRQKSEGANRIVRGAHAVLAGSRPDFDFEINATGQQVDAGGKLIENPVARPDWSFINIQLNQRADVAQTQIIQWLLNFRQMGLATGRHVYVEGEDLVLCAGNGWKGDEAGALIQQSPINLSLSNHVNPETDDNPKYTIDAGKEIREFTVNDRIMCTKNESPDRADRITNGSRGIITKIEPNMKWSGDRRRFGSRREVIAHMRQSAVEAVKAAAELHSADILERISSFNTDELKDDLTSERQASHKVTVRYDTGVMRTYSTAAAVASIQLGFAVTVHKAQGSQADTVFLICHSGASRMLNREWLYTGITRAKERLVVMSTGLGLRTAVSRQQIFGRTLADKIRLYAGRLDDGKRNFKLTPE